MANVVLSICIPTFNRAILLERTLSALVSEPAFKSGIVEICISDNASTDHTEDVVKQYSTKFNNIKYNRNKENTVIIDGNFPIVAALASGTYIKFLNDYAYFKQGELDRIIEFITANIERKPVLFFSNKNLLNKTDEFITCDSLDSFVQAASYWTTWVLCAGMWREDFLSINDRDRKVEKYMWCPDNYLRLLSSGRKAIIYNREFCNISKLNKKGGYNIFQVFGINYLQLYDDYLNSKQIKRKTYNTERYRLFRHFLINWYNVLYSSSDNPFSFERNNSVNFLMVNYRFKPYFYFGLMWLYLKLALKKVKSLALNI